MSWSSGLRPASWRGVPFSVTTGEAELARRSAVHEYPFRDDVFVEDLGAGRNSWQVTGRLVGDDCISLRDQMTAAVQTPGVGELIHPTFGSLQVACVGYRAGEAWDNGRVIELEFLFVRASERRFPAAAADTGAAVGAAADQADAAAEGDFLTRAKAMYSAGRAAVDRVVTTARTYVGAAQRLVGDATSALHAVGAVVPGADRVLSRYTRGARAIIGRPLGLASSYIRKAATARTGVERLGANVGAAADRL